MAYPETDSRTGHELLNINIKCFSQHCYICLSIHLRHKVKLIQLVAITHLSIRSHETFESPSSSGQKGFGEVEELEGVSTRFCNHFLYLGQGVMQSAVCITVCPQLMLHNAGPISLILLVLIFLRTSQVKVNHKF